MIVDLTKYPTKFVNRILLIAGLAVFIPAYISNYPLITSIMSLDVLTKLLASFDYDYFRDAIASIHQSGNIGILFTVYVLNIISIIGFMSFTFSLTTGLARKIGSGNLWGRAGFIAPLLIVVIGVLDITASFMFLYVGQNVQALSYWMMVVIDLCYVIRIGLLYLVVLWAVISGVCLLIRKVRCMKNTAERLTTVSWKNKKQRCNYYRF